MTPAGSVQRLTGTEREAIRSTVQPLAEGREIVALAAYGSHVAGYARPDSDYDALLVLAPYPSTVRYRYVRREADVSALIADRDALVADAERASLGEFVAGRLLNVYEPLHGAELLASIELACKRRIALELLTELATEYGDLAAELRIPVAYFLYEKLKQRAAVYPPALYSYAKTYGGPLAHENLEASLRGFRHALRLLADDGWLSLVDDHVTLTASLKARSRARLQGTLTRTARGLTQYAVHGYAGRVGFEVAGREALSKLARAKQVDHVPEELQRPKSLWRLEEGLLLAEGDDWLPQVLNYLGLPATASVTREHLGELYNVSAVYTVAAEAQTVKLAVKRFRDVWSVKWAFLNLWALPSKHFNLTPLARLSREVIAIRALRRAGLRTPEIVAVVLAERILVTRFVEGVDLGRIVGEVMNDDATQLAAITRYGEVLGRVHAAGNVLGDTKPSNAVLCDGDLVLVDLEQAAPDGDRAWDVAEFLYYATKLSLNAEAARRLTRAFLDGYSLHGDPKAVARALHLKYLAPFQPFLVPTVAAAVRRVMTERAKGAASLPGT